MTVDSLPDIVKRLQKRSTFESAVTELGGLLRSEASAGLDRPSADLFKALTRCRTVLKTRFTSPAFWQAGRHLCFISQVATVLTLQSFLSFNRDQAEGVLTPLQELFNLDKSQTQLISEFLADCDAIQQEIAQQPLPPQDSARASFLFEGQLSQVKIIGMCWALNLLQRSPFGRTSTEHISLAPLGQVWQHCWSMDKIPEAWHPCKLNAQADVLGKPQSGS